MVRQALPAVAIRTRNGQIIAQSCSPDGGCLWSQVNFHVSDYSDGTSVIAYHDPHDPMRNAQIVITDACQRDLLVAIMDAIDSLAPEQP